MSECFNQALFCGKFLRGSNKMSIFEKTWKILSIGKPNLVLEPGF